MSRPGHPDQPLPRPARHLLLGTAAVVITLLLLDTVVAVGLEGVVPEGMRRFLDLTREENLPTAVSVGLLLAVAALAARNAREAWRKERSAPAEALAWFGIATFFAYMAVDDALGLHERAATAIAERLREAPRGGAAGWLLDFPSYYWQVLFLPLFGTAGLLTLAFVLRRLHGRTARAVLLAGIGCYVLAVILDFVEGLGWVHVRLASWLTLLGPDVIKHLLRAYEEAIEMVGTGLLGAAFLSAAPGSRPGRGSASGT